MPAEDAKIDAAQRARNTEFPIRPEPNDDGIPAGQSGEVEHSPERIASEDLAGSNTETVRNAVSDLDGEDADQPDSDNPNDYGQD